tara:strand:- start:436 stop:609 length:174 start_codon:yes stop_codon:yes gene_type:complete
MTSKEQKTIFNGRFKLSGVFWFWGEIIGFRLSQNACLVKVFETESQLNLINANLLSK